jgi:hypothetical protein
MNNVVDGKLWSWPVAETQGLPYVYVLLDRGIEERGVHVHEAELEVNRGADGEYDTKTRHANDCRECFGVVHALTLTAPFGNKSGFEALDLAQVIGFHLVHPHVVDHSTAWGEVNECQCTVLEKGVDLMSHRRVLVSCLGAGKGIGVRRWFGDVFG